MATSLPSPSILTHPAADICEDLRAGRISSKEALAWAETHLDVDVARAAIALNAGSGIDALWKAIDEHHLSWVRVLVDAGVDIDHDEDYVLQLAAQWGDLEMVEFFLSVGLDPSQRESLALAYAAGCGNMALVERLLPLCDPKAVFSAPIRCAAQNNHWSIVERLIPLSDVCALDDYVFRMAVAQKNMAVFDRLYPLANHAKALENMREYCAQYGLAKDYYGVLEDRMMIDAQRQTLHEEVCKGTPSQVVRKKRTL